VPVEADDEDEVELWSGGVVELGSGVVCAVLVSEDCVLVSELDELESLLVLEDDVDAVGSDVSSIVSFDAHAASARVTAAAMLRK
jgi:hypothetical protein